MTTCENLPPWKASSMPNEPMWYFGYGSNMKASSMADRKITPLKTKVVTVPTHFVTFDIFGIPYSEPSYASLEQFPDGGHGKLDLLHRRNRTQVPPACGVGHLLNPVDFHRLLVTEGSGVVYNLIEVQAYELAPDGRPILAPFPVYTLKAKWPQRPNGIPSARYMNIFLQGARDHNLPPAYIEYLEKLPRYQKVEGPERTAGQLVFDRAWRPFLKRLVRITTWKVDEDGNCPFYVAHIIVWLYQLMWKYHDLIHRHIFEEGDGGKLHYVRVRE
ncbi:unnamed protein product [Clonostachys rhizophaga]|uniref:gamma-glutamylcyclotransferase n=1 Tax=Clonostachys rhizophaga TaxID=160324 RepID=A0A9N9YI79_9HYPO|nr:unnamed protein product [Clonostachys rhizophaga]